MMCADNCYIGNKLWYLLYCILGNCVGSIDRCCVIFTVVRWGYCTGISICKQLFYTHSDFFLITVGVLLWLKLAWCCAVASVSGFLHLAWYVLPGSVCPFGALLFIPSRLQVYGAVPELVVRALEGCVSCGWWQSATLKLQYYVSFSTFLCLPVLLPSHGHVLNKLWNIIGKKSIIYVILD